jgi:hypothetical protein
VEEVPIKSFADDVQRKLSIRKMMQPGRKQVQAEAIEPAEDIEEIGAAGSGMGGSEYSSTSPGSTTLPGGDDEAIEAEVAPPGYEDMVLKLKKDKSVDNPFAIAWAAYNRAHGKKSGKESAQSVRATLLEANAMSPQLFQQWCRRFAR